MGEEDIPFSFATFDTDAFFSFGRGGPPPKTMH